MQTKIWIIAFVLLLVACKGNKSSEPDVPEVPDPKGTIYFTETDEQMCNPERGFYTQKYYTTADLEDTVSVESIISSRDNSHVTLYLHSYYLTDYIESDIAQAFLDRMDRNMNALRAGGAKAILRFSYKSNHSLDDKPWDAKQEWALKHIDQIAPYLMKHADVIYCVQAGFIGSWGEWYYTTNYQQNPSKDSGYEKRWPVAERLMEVVPADRQICFRQPQFKIRYLRTHDMAVSPLTASEAYQPTIKARWAGHNDCFVSSVNDVGTYHNDEERAFWAEDTKYTLMGGETCEECEYSNGENAVREMEKYHWSYLCNSYHPTILASWVNTGHYDVIKRRLGYRFALDKASFTQQPKAGEKFEMRLTLHNSGFAAPANKRAVELVFVKSGEHTQKYVFPQTAVDPRFWLPKQSHQALLFCNLPKDMHGEYHVCLNLPDPYPSLHDDPRYSIQLANTNMWDKETGYNYLTTVTVD